MPERHLESAVVGPSAEKALRCLLQNQENQESPVTSSCASFTTSPALAQPEKIFLIDFMDQQKSFKIANS